MYATVPTVSGAGLEIDGNRFCIPVVLMRRYAMHRDCPCQTKVENLCLPAGRDEQVGRFDVAVNDASVMRGVERIGDLATPFEQLG
jgi:hypothetical protein